MTQQDGKIVDSPSITIEQDGENFDGNDLVESASISNGDKEAEPALEPENRIQILDLYSTNPIISYQNQIYSCEWTSTIGTDVLLTTPDPDFAHPVLKEEQGVSVLAATNIKLFGRSAQVAARATDNDKRAASASGASTAMPDNASASNQATPVKIPLGLAAKQPRINQAKFLERLIAIKAAKGEKDEVTIHAKKPNQGLGWRSQQRERRASEDVEAELARDGGSGPTTPTARRGSIRGRSRVGRPRGVNSRTAGPWTKKGGLFSDYRPQLFDTGGASIGNQPSATPSSWDQLSPSRTDDESGIRQQTAATSSSTPTSVPTPGHHPPASPPSIDPPNTDYMRTDTAPNAPPGPDEALARRHPDPTRSSAPLMAGSESEQRASATGRGAGVPSLVGSEVRSSVSGSGGDGDGGDGDGGLGGRVERNSGSDVEMEDG